MRTYADMPVEEMNAMLARLQRSGREIGRHALLETVIGVESAAQFDAPVKTGFLQGSHFVEPRQPADEIAVGASAEYAMAVHERHPSKSGWFARVLREQLKRITEAAFRTAARERGPR